MTKQKAYEALGIEVNASIEEIKVAYAELSKKYHPEEKAEEFQQIHEAYITLIRQNRNRNRMMSHISVVSNTDMETAIQESIVEEENAFDFSNVDEAKQEEFERKLQSVIKQLDGVMYIDKNIDNVMLKRILNSKEREFIYSEEFIEKLVALLKVAFVNNETVRVVKQYLRPWDATLDDKRDALNKLKTVLEERNKDYWKNHTTEDNQKATIFIICTVIGIMLLVCLATNFWGVLNIVVSLLILGGMMFLIFKVCKKNNPEAFAFMLASFTGFVILLFAYLFEIWKWLFNSQSVKAFIEFLLLGTAFITIVFYSEWKRRKK